MCNRVDLIQSREAISNDSSLLAGRKALIVPHDKTEIRGGDSRQGDHRQPGMGFVQPLGSVDRSGGYSEFETHERRRLPGKGTDERIYFTN